MLSFVKDWTSQKHMADMVEHYVVTAIDNFRMTREGHPRFLIWLPSEFGATKDYWEENAYASGRLFNATYTCPATGNQIQVRQTI